MRKIGSLDNQKNARRFSAYLRSIHIENTCEISFDQDKSALNCAIWVQDEDAVEKALQEFADFQKNPDDSKFAVDLQSIARPVSAIANPRYQKARSKAPPIFITIGILLACCLCFFINALQEGTFSLNTQPKPVVVVTPIASYFMYGMPSSFSKLNEAFAKYNITKATLEKDLPQKVMQEIKESSNTPYFRGFYRYLIDYLKGEPVEISPLFVKIRQGQIWRFFTPALLHKNLLHIVFNMLVLWMLGRQIEARLSPFRYIFFLLIAAFVSNTFQYLMSGPLFLGFSVVLLAMAGFIWMRQKTAPWEGYPLSKSTLMFLVFFITTIALLQMLSFFFEFSGQAYDLQIANTAHITGAVTGILLGRLRFFSWRVD
mgnify:CR=1 FL=1